MLAEERLPSVPALPAARKGIRFHAPSLYAVAAVAVLGAITLVALAPRFDPDFWWHLQVGSYIAAHHAVPSHDYLTYAFRGRAWTDHEWLAELLMYGLYSLAGLHGPLIFFAGVIGGAFCLTYLVMVQRGVNRPLALLLLIVAAGASSGSWGPRIQMITLLFVAAYAFLLHRFDLTRDRRYLAALPAIMLFWANMHGGFVVGLAILVLTLLGETLNARSGGPGAWSEAERRALAMALGASLLVTVINPNGLRQLLYPLTFVLPNAFTNLIQESASPNFHLAIMMLFEALLLLLLAALFVGRRRPNWTHLLLILAFTHLALSQMRNVPLWCVLLTPLVALYTQGMFGWAHHGRRLAGGIKSAINLVFLLVLLGALLKGGAYVTSASTIRQYERQSFPAGAVTYLQRHHLPPHVFVSYRWGGYLLWNLFPTYRDFMDSRADTLFSAAILHRYLAVYAAAPNWRSELAATGAGTVLVERNAPLTQVLARDPAWRLAYHDRKAVIFTRTGAKG